MRMGKRTNANQRTWSDQKFMQTFMAEFACSDVGIDHESCVATHHSSKRKEEREKVGKRIEEKVGHWEQWAVLIPGSWHALERIHQRLFANCLSCPAICTATGSFRWHHQLTLQLVMSSHVSSLISILSLDSTVEIELLGDCLFTLFEHGPEGPVRRKGNQDRQAWTN